MATLSSLVISLTARTTGFEAGMTRASRSMARTARKFKAIGQDISLAVTGPLILLGGGAVKAATDFETAFTGVQKTVNASAEELALLRQGILRMSQTLPATAVEISAVAEAAGQLGIKTKDILRFTKVMIDLGNTTDIVAKEGAITLARFAGVAGVSADEFEILGSVIVELGNNFRATEAEILDFSQNLASSGRIINLSFDQTLAFGTALASVGVNAEAGGTALQKMFFKMKEAVSVGGKALKEFGEVAGLSGQQFAKEFAENSGEAVFKFLKGLGDIEEAGGSSIRALARLQLNSERVRKTLLALSLETGQVRRALDKASLEVKRNTALSTEAELRYKTFASQLSVFKNQITAVGISIGEEIIPALKDMLRAATPILLGLKKMAKSFSELSDGARLTAITIVGLFGIAGPVLFVLGTFAGAVSAILQPAVLAIGLLAFSGKMVITQWESIFTGALTILNFFIDESKKSISGFVAGFGIIAGLIEPILRRMGSAGQEGINRLKESFRQGIDEILAGSSNFGFSLDELQNKLAALDEQTKNAAANMAKNFGNGVRQIKNKLADMQKSFGELSAATKSVAKNLEDSLTQAALTGKLAMKDFVQSAIADLTRLAIRGAILGIFTGKGPTPGAFFPGLADGGFAKRGAPVVVGERGPELFVPSVSGAVIPNDISAQMGGGGGNEVNFAPTINIPAAAFADRAQARKMVSMLVEELRNDTDLNRLLGVQVRDIGERNKGRST